MISPNPDELGKILVRICASMMALALLMIAYVAFRATQSTSDAIGQDSMPTAKQKETLDYWTNELNK